MSQRILKSRSLQTINPSPPQQQQQQQQYNDDFYSGSSQSCNNLNSYYMNGNGSETTTNSNNSSNRSSLNYGNGNGNGNNNFNNNDNSNQDQNFDIIKNEYYNLSGMIYNIYDSLNHYCNSIKDIYLNSNSFMNNIQKYFGPEHPLSKYGFGVIENANQGFGEWMENQQPNFQILGEYVQELDTMKLKIERVDQLSQQLNDSNISEYTQLKDELFRDVSNQIDNRINRFDIPLIQTQLSLSSLYQCLNTIHETNGTEKLQQPIQEVQNPIRESNLLPDNTFYYLQKQQQQQQQQQPLEQAQAYEQSYQPPPPVQQQQQSNNSAQSLRPTYQNNNSLLISKPIKTEIPSASGPKKLERFGARDYAHAPPQPQQPSPLKQIPRPQSSQFINNSNNTNVPSAPPQEYSYYDQPPPLGPVQPQQSAEPSYTTKQPTILRQVLPISNNPPPPSNNSNDESGVIEQPLRPVPHKSVQARPPLGGPINGSKPPLSPLQPNQPLPSQQQQSPLAPTSKPNFTQQPPSPRSNPPNTQPNPLQQIPRPAPSPYAANNNNNNNNVQQFPQQPNLSFSKPPTASFSRPLPSSVSSVQHQQQTNFSIPNYPVQPIANNTSKPPGAPSRHLRTRSVDSYSQNNHGNNI